MNLWQEFLITNIPVNSLLGLSCYCVRAAGRPIVVFSWAHSIWNRVTAQFSIVPATADAVVSLLHLLAHYATFYDPDLHTNPSSDRFFSCNSNGRQHLCSLSPCTEQGQLTGLIDPPCFLWARCLLAFPGCQGRTASLQQSPVLFSIFQKTSFPGQLTLNLCPRILSSSRQPRLCAAYSQNQPKCPLKFWKGFSMTIFWHKGPYIMPGKFLFILSCHTWAMWHLASRGRQQVMLLEQPKHLPQLRRRSITGNFLPCALFNCFVNVNLSWWLCR